MAGDLLKSYGIGFPLMGNTEDEFWMLGPKERAILVAAWFADVAKVKEETRNRGKWVDRFIRAIKLDPVGRYAWCAAFVFDCLRLAEAKLGPTSGAGAVRNWVAWAKKENRLGFPPKRGDLFYWLNANGTGHIGFVVRVKGNFIETIEGNTDAGGSREGDGVYRKTRPVSKVQFIRL